MWVTWSNPGEGLHAPGAKTAHYWPRGSTPRLLCGKRAPGADADVRVVKSGVRKCKRCVASAEKRLGRRTTAKKPKAVRPQARRPKTISKRRR